jgi:hypothetical protein
MAGDQMKTHLSLYRTKIWPQSYQKWAFQTIQRLLLIFCNYHLFDLPKRLSRQ